MTNYEKVVDFNKCFGSYLSEKEDPLLYNKLPKLVNLKYSLIKEEVDELLEAFNDNNLIEIIDALSDIKYVLYGMASGFGVNMDTEFLKYLCSKPKLQNTKLEYEDKSDFRIVVEIYLSDFSNRLHYPQDYLSNIVKPYFNQALQHYIDVINKCCNTLKETVIGCDFKAMKQELCSLLYNVNIFGAIIGIDLDQAFDIVHSSNMTKVCKDEETAKKTVTWYLENDKRYKTPTYLKNEYGYIIINQDTGKVLKSIEYTPANFLELLVEN